MKYTLEKDPSYYIKWRVVERLEAYPHQRMVQRFKTRRSAQLFVRLLNGDRSAVGAYLSSYYKEHKDLPELTYETGLMLKAAPWVGA